MTVPNGWIDNARPKSWRIVEDREQMEIVFDTEHGQITWWGGLKTDASRGYTEKQMRKCGWTGDWERLDIKTSPVSILVEEEIYNNKSRQKVKAVGTGGGEGERAPKDPVKARSLISRLKGGVTSGSDPFSNAPQLDEGGPDPDRQPGDDIPF